MPVLPHQLATLAADLQSKRRFAYGLAEQQGLPVFKSGTTQRVVYPTTASEGTTVLATFPDEIEEVLTNAAI